MSWLLLALIPPALYAISNHIDKFLLSRYFKGSQVGSLVLFSSLFSIFALPIIYFFERDLFSIGQLEIGVLIFNGIISILALVIYFYALDDDETSNVVPLMQLAPIISFILAYFILGEVLNFKEILACLLIVAGAVLISLNFQEKMKFKFKMVSLMILVSLLLAVATVVFKVVALEGGFLVSLFWDFFGKVIIGVVFFILIKSYRGQFLNVIKNNNLSVLALNSFNEIIFIVADWIFCYVSLFIPVAVVSSLGGAQPLFTLIFGFILTVYFPKLGKESMGKKDIAQKIIAIILIVIGTFMIGDKL